MTAVGWIPTRVLGFGANKWEIFAFTLAYAGHTLRGSVEPGYVILRDIKPAHFDARTFNVPEADVVNYFIWRQQDATRNAISMAARSVASHSECQELNSNQLQELMFQKGLNFNDYSSYWKRGRALIRPGPVREDVPIFTKDRFYLEKFMEIEEP